MSIQRLDLQHTALLVVDVQAKLTAVMHEKERLLRRIDRLVRGFAALKLPMLVTEQYRKGLGDTVEPINRHLASAVCRHEKLQFSAFIKPIHEELLRLQARSVVVCGIEAHVCVLQTCLDLVDAGFVAAVAADAISSRRDQDARMAMQRMIQAGVLPCTTESILLELVHEAGSDRFKTILPLIK